jgi:hypothetical protein
MKRYDDLAEWIIVGLCVLVILCLALGVLK